MNAGDRQQVSGADKAGRPRWRRWLRYACGAFVGIVLLLGAARLALPSYLRSYVNRTLDESADFSGSVGKIDVRLWRGAYTIHDITVFKRLHSVPVPFFEGDRVSLSLDWGSLMHGRARGRIVLERPKLNFVQGPTPEESQSGANQQWLGMINELFPFRIDKAKVRDGEIHFRAYHKRPQVDVYLSDVDATMTNLTNIEDTLDPLVARVKATGRAMESGRFQLDMTLDPQSHRPTFDLAARLLDLDVRKLNPLALAYGDFDFKAGTFDLVVELAAKDGHVHGYAKPLFRNVQVMSLRDIGNKDPLQTLWEALVGVVGEVFKNHSRDQFGTRITLEGDLDNPRASILEAVGNVLRNAFVRAYLPRIEGRVAPSVAPERSSE